MGKGILLVGWEEFKWETMLSDDLKVLSKTKHIAFAPTFYKAFYEIANAKFIEKKQIEMIVFNKNSLFINNDKTLKAIEFAKKYSKSSLRVIDLICSDKCVDLKKRNNVEFSQNWF